jgi:hypothetical protein
LEMKRLWVLLCAALIALAPVAGSARGFGHGGYHSSHSSGFHSHRASFGRSHYHYASHHRGFHSGSYRRSAWHSGRTNYGEPYARDSRGRLKRSTAAKDAFKRGHPCPSTGQTHGRCPGYVIDHVQALKHGGRDDPSNMQWQTIEAAKAKDKWE